MTELKKQFCKPYHSQEPAATLAEIEQFKAQISGWNISEIEGEFHLEKVYQFPDFKSALAFTNAVGDAAETDGHHPALLTEWGKVKVSWWTHAVGGLHKNDFIMAAKTDDIKTSFLD